MPSTTSFSSTVLLLFLLLNLSASKAPVDKDGESMWGHIYMEDGATSFEFFRALFGGVYGCSPNGYEVALAPVTTTVINDDEEEAFLIGDGCEPPPADSITGKMWLVRRGTCSFNDKAIVAEKAGASGMIVVNNAPGLLRMPSGVLKQKKNFDLTIPAVMITDVEGRMLHKFLKRDPQQHIRIIGESSSKGKLTKVGACSTMESGNVEVNADGTTSASTKRQTVKLIEGGVLHLDGTTQNTDDKITYEFLRGMFGGPLPRNALPMVMATPEDGCGPITNAAEVAGKIAIVVRGACMFTNKGTNVERAGASGMIVINRDTKDITRMWAGENEMRAITIPSVMVTGATGEVLLESIQSNPKQGILMKASSVRNEHWQQLSRFFKVSDWPEDDDEREELYGKLLDIHDPEKSAVGHNERLALLTNSFNQAERYFDASSVSV